MTGRAWPRHGVMKLGDVPANMDGWMVPSRTTVGAYWHVTWTTSGGLAWRCTCPAGAARGAMRAATTAGPGPCRHVRAVAAAEADDGIPARPAGTINPSAFVD